MSDWLVAPVTAAEAADWARLRQALWPDQGYAAAPPAVDVTGGDHLALLARAPEGQAVGLAEAAIRRDWVNGCDDPPVLFLEGLYVAPAWRRRGLARALVDAVAAWGRARGLHEFGSDAPLGNHASHRVHRALGFAETERVVFFRRELAAAR